MNNFNKLYQKMSCAESIYNTRKDAFYNLINEVLSVFDLDNDNIDNVVITKDTVQVCCN